MSANKPIVQTFIVIELSKPPPKSAMEAAIVALKARGIPIPWYLNPPN